MDAGAPRLRILLTVKNTSSERLVLGTGGERDDWIPLYIAGRDAGNAGSSRGSSDRAREGRAVCPPSEWVVVVPSGGSISRIQEIDLSAIGGVADRVTLEVRILTFPASLRCGPAHFIERTVHVGEWSGKPLTADGGGQ
jgi:hypothetical protein